ncbi:hypothetical protein BHM03_00015555 [Ensete ventricosum]|nr:hypothetical protein BHM03_00015555 [Ensete ventricosum]
MTIRISQSHVHALDWGSDDAVRNSPGVRRELTEDIGSLPGLCKRIHQKKTETRRKIIGIGQRVNYLYLGFRAIEPPRLAGEPPIPRFFCELSVNSRQAPDTFGKLPANSQQASDTFGELSAISQQVPTTSSEPRTDART